MRISIIAEHYPPAEGGVATSARRIARSLSGQGACVRVFCFDRSRPLTDDDYVVEERDDGVVVSRIGPFFLNHPDAQKISEKERAVCRRRALEQLVRLAAGGTDVLLSLYLLEAGFLAQLLGHHIQVPVVAGVRGNDIGLNLFRHDRFGVTQWVISRADRVVCVNEHLRQRVLLALPEAGPRTTVVPNGVPVTPPAGQRHRIRRQVCAAAGWSKADLIVTFIGTLREKKGSAPLLHALALLGADAGVRLLVIGPELGLPETLSSGGVWEKLRHARVIHATGQVPRDEVAHLARAADVVVMPSLDDGLANGLLEGMSLGLCPVVSDLFADVVRDGETGRVVPRGDPRALAEALRELAVDREAVREWGRRARTHVLRHHTVEREAQQYLDIFDSVVAGRRDGLPAVPRG